MSQTLQASNGSEELKSRYETQHSFYIWLKCTSDKSLDILRLDPCTQSLYPATAKTTCWTDRVERSANHLLEWAGLSSNKRALYFTSKMAKKSPSEKLPLDLQECEHVNPKTGLVEYLTALVLSFVNYKQVCSGPYWGDYVHALLTEVHHREILGQSKWDSSFLFWLLSFYMRAGGLLPLTITMNLIISTVNI